ncbi:hypothetical protein LWC34_41000 [Kibdelosporangium philippinense]|uniref:Transmembrane protein n=2 Tax=Kibdelosporangium philippinense TaxID=211113 RepID=A0ABS8ZN41_9PSEU|nr:hypothetical protein [Kibdelosporangium philippinense]MCE7009149.1 hypothetical protein [Kibdelosporangium philippinense]
MMSAEHKNGFHPSQVAVAALSAVTAAILGSTLGVAGTVLGAAIGAIVTTVAAELYARSIDRVRSRVVKSGDDEPAKKTRRVRWQLLAGGTLAAFVVGMLVITGIEWVRGEPLSGDAKTTIGGVLQPSDHGQQKSTSPKMTPPPPTVTVTETPSPPSITTTTTPPPTSGSGSSSVPSTSGSVTDPVQSDTPSKTPGGL